MGPKRSVTYDTTFQRTAHTLQQDYPLRVVGYVRVSTDIQAQEGVSLDAQQERIQAYCVASGFRLVHLAQDDTSAKSLDRPGLAGALKLLECGKADALLVVTLIQDTAYTNAELNQFLGAIVDLAHDLHMQVTVEGGMRLHEVNAYLARHGLALTSLGSIDQQAVAGIIATGTHGSGARFRCISAQVARLELVDGRGQVVTLARGDADVAGAVVGLGALGVTTAVTFDVVPAFQLHDVTTRASFADAALRALEGLGDKDGACGAYQTVLRQWVAPRPRSVTVEEAKRRVAALSCAGS